MECECETKSNHKPAAEALSEQDETTKQQRPPNKRKKSQINPKSKSHTKRGDHHFAEWMNNYTSTKFHPAGWQNPKTKPITTSISEFGGLESH